eukprot:83230-Hanusia_phi.AAC.1
MIQRSLCHRVLISTTGPGRGESDDSERSASRPRIDSLARSQLSLSPRLLKGFHMTLGSLSPMIHRAEPQTPGLITDGLRAPAELN